MIASGTTITTVGLAAEGPSLGTSTVVVVIGGENAATGAVLVAHGSMMAANGAKNLVSKKGHLNENAPRGSGNKHSSGKGTQLPSKTLWKGKGKSGARIDVENSNPTQRRGQIHYQEGNKKYIYDSKSNTFRDAPNQVNRLLTPAKDSINLYLSDNQ